LPEAESNSSGIGGRVSDAISWRLRSAWWTLVDVPERIAAWVQYQQHAGEYSFIGERELLASRTSDTVFIFGSGASLNAITADEWERIGRHNTMGFNWFVRQQFVRCDYHLIREVVPHALRAQWRQEVETYFRLFRENPRFADAIVVVQAGFRALSGNRAIGTRLLPTRNRVFPFRSTESTMPSAAFSDGLAHGAGTLTECVNFAALAGWTRIVIAGVDLYDRRYFWLAGDQTVAGDTTVDEPHRTVGVVDTLRDWRKYYEGRGISVFVHNPRSLLSAALPVWAWPQ
jgi:hypothetical protein